MCRTQKSFLQRSENQRWTDNALKFSSRTIHRKGIQNQTRYILGLLGYTDESHLREKMRNE